MSDKFGSVLHRAVQLVTADRRRTELDPRVDGQSEDGQGRAGGHYYCIRAV